MDWLKNMKVASKLKVMIMFAVLSMLAIGYTGYFKCGY